MNSALPSPYSNEIDDAVQTTQVELGIDQHAAGRGQGTGRGRRRDVGGS